MPLSKNQDKRGTEHGSSANDVAKTGRDSGFGPSQSKRGTEHGSGGSSDADRSTRPVPEKTQSSRGTTKAKLESDAGVSRLPDYISSVGESY